jgi:predicted ester cyclase
MPGFISDSPLARDLIRIGDEAIAREDDAALRAYFAEGYVFHGPGGDLGFDGLSAYFASLRAAFSDLRLVREQIIADGNFLAARTTFSGDFTGVFTYSPVGPVEPTGQHLEWEVLGTFRYDDPRAAGRGVGADRLPQLPGQARRHHDGVRQTEKVIAVLTSPEGVDIRPTAATRQPAPTGSLPDRDVTCFADAPQHGSLPSPYRGGSVPIPASRPDRSSLRRPLIVLAIGTFAIGTEAFVIGGVLPAVARSLGVSTSSAGLLVTAFAVAYALGAPILAVASARLARRALLVSALTVFVAANGRRAQQ